MVTVRWGDFEWDDAKAIANVASHGVDFEEAASSFLDDWGIDYPDVAHPDRLNWIGMSLRSRVVLVVYAELLPEERVRIISARKATPHERARYEHEG